MLPKYHFILPFFSFFVFPDDKDNGWQTTPVHGFSGHTSSMGWTPYGYKKTRSWNSIKWSTSKIFKVTIIPKYFFNCHITCLISNLEIHDAVKLIFSYEEKLLKQTICPWQGLIQSKILPGKLVGTFMWLFEYWITVELFFLLKKLDGYCNLLDN